MKPSLFLLRFSLSLFLISLLGISETVFAEDTGIGTEFPTVMRGTRPLGMGNAFLAMPGTDYNAQFYNPAAINDYEKKHHMLFVNPQAEFNTGFYSMIQDIFDLNKDLKDKTDSQKIDTFDAFTQSHAGQFHHFGVGLPLFHIRHKYYSAGLIMDSRGSFSLRNRAFPNFETRTDNVVGIVGGSAASFFDDTLQVGANLKVLYKVGIEEQITQSDILTENLGTTFKYANWEKGFGVGIDFGSKYVLPIWQESLRPTVAVTIQDVADTRFTGRAPNSPMSVSAGAGVFPKVGKFEFAVLADVRETNRKQTFLKKLHAGTEVKFPEFAKIKSSLRLGTNQGYFATGGSLEFPVVALHVAFYGEELGEVTRAKGSYRLNSQLTFGF
ncbi:MAG: hypothetical protein A3I05_03850 [Deltaproteobacteria bacterium RIFCSPLOWO2_02_FULL_44_10]|nr:MAG: hypothetical protein A3C46_07960 [Deltaproteobacteria bacterium RIFCSPHIGHO2_02_FULL_44_16]OGQ47097.1 MAG: hypothetical protein A3I05_03850 [Deltaproteobacteria bacterium RIFCSPLOWO2_02_FULL_44_10]